MYRSYVLNMDPISAKEGSEKIQEYENCVYEEKKAHLLAEYRCFLMASSWDRWWLGDPGPPLKTRSPGRSSDGPKKEGLLYFF